MNINSKWEKGIALGCTHGDLINTQIAEPVFKYAQKGFKYRIHLGDYIDTAALRSGADVLDLNKSLESDITAAEEMFKSFNPTHVINGNHDDRIWKNLNHPNKVIQLAVRNLHTRLSKAIKRTARYWKTEYDITDQKQLKIGNFTFLHGFMYNRRAIEDHVKYFGNVILAHLHRTGIERAERTGNPYGICVGTLADINKMSYAKGKKSTGMWGAGFVEFETNGKITVPRLIIKPQNGDWRF